jgi:hypothetical protein
MQGGEIELLKQPFSRLRYVGDIAGFEQSKKPSVPCISQTLYRPFPMMISQQFGWEKSVGISIQIEIMKLPPEKHKAF